MTKFLDKSFTVPMQGDDEYRSNWERTFRKKEEVSKVRSVEKTNDFYSRPSKPVEDFSQSPEYTGIGRTQLIYMIVDLKKRIAELEGRLTIKGWWCICGIFNGEEKEPLSVCRSCGVTKCVRPLVSEPTEP